MPKYTQGPWQIVAADEYVAIRVQSDNELIAVVVETPDGRMRDNAALLVHAPEMHESLRTVEAYLEQLIADETRATQHAHNTLRFVRALLEKIRDSATRSLP